MKTFSYAAVIPLALVSVFYKIFYSNKCYSCGCYPDYHCKQIHKIYPEEVELGDIVLDPA
jgi:hypothetical protein